MLLGVRMLEDEGGFCLASQTQMLKCKVEDLLSCIQALGSDITFFFFSLLGISDIQGIAFLPPGSLVYYHHSPPTYNPTKD